MVPPRALPDLRTERLELRPVAETDLRHLVALNADPKVMKHVRGRASSPSETAAEWADRLAHRVDPTRGLGHWLGFEDGDFVGWWSASYFAPRPEISGIGFRLRASHWGRGLATEGARAMVEQAFADPGITGVFASTAIDNTGSRRVLEKLGMEQHPLLPADDRGPALRIPRVRYELARAA